jgi:hypothetical protein
VAEFCRRAGTSQASCGRRASTYQSCPRAFKNVELLREPNHHQSNSNQNEEEVPACAVVLRSHFRTAVQWLGPAVHQAKRESSMPDRAKNDFATMRCRARVVPLRNVNKKFKRVISGSAPAVLGQVAAAWRTEPTEPRDGMGPSQRRLSQTRPNEMLTRASASLRCRRFGLSTASHPSRPRGAGHEATGEDFARRAVEPARAPALRAIMREQWCLISCSHWPPQCSIGFGRKARRDETGLQRRGEAFIQDQPS